MLGKQPLSDRKCQHSRFCTLQTFCSVLPSRIRPNSACSAERESSLWFCQSNSMFPAPIRIEKNFHGSWPHNITVCQQEKSAPPEGYVLGRQEIPKCISWTAKVEESRQCFSLVPLPLKWRRVKWQTKRLVLTKPYWQAPGTQSWRQLWNRNRLGLNVLKKEKSTHFYFVLPFTFNLTFRERKKNQEEKMPTRLGEQEKNFFPDIVKFIALSRVCHTSITYHITKALPVQFC